MKKIFLFLIAVCMGFASCSLKEEPYKSIPIDAFFNEEKDFHLYLNGVYSLLVTGNTWGGAAIATLLYDDDDTQAGSSYRPGIDGKYDMINRTADAWRGFFALIQQANTLLYSLDSKGHLIVTEGRANRYRGEALFLRAHAYLELTRRFGPVPLRLQPYIEGQNSQDCARSSQKDVYEHLIRDMGEAAKYLPVNYSTGYSGDADRGKPTRQAAIGLAMKIYMHLAGAEAYGSTDAPDLTKQIECYQQVVELGDSLAKLALVQGFPALETNYMKPFDPETQNTCNEILFSAQTLTNISNKGVELAFTLCPPVSGYSGTDGSGGGQVTLRWDFVGRKFYPEDVRIKWGTAIVDSFFNAKTSESRWYYVYNPYVRPTTDTKSGAVPLGWETNYNEETWNSTYAPPNIPSQNEKGYGWDRTIDVWWQDTGTSRKATPKLYSLKYTDPKAIGKLDNGSDIVLIRYSDLLLLYAEALNELDNQTDAITQLDKVRDRAGIPLITDIDPSIAQDPLRDSIRLERRRELYLEFNRRWDLIRWGEFTSTMTEAKRPREWWQNLYAIPIQEITGNGLINENNYGW